MDITLKTYLQVFNEHFTLFCVFPAMILLGLYLTVRLKFVQFFKLKESFSHLLRKQKGSQGNISHFEAISSVLAGNFGTGNISGMAVAITTGGPGSLVWMWLIAFLGAAIQYASCLLGVKYRTENEEGEFVGGPMYYLSKGLGFKSLSVIFSILTILGAVAVGDFAQINSICLPLTKLGIHPFISGLVMAFLVGIVILGGLQRIAKFASLIVPLKAFLYLGTAFVIIFLNYEQLIPALQLMLKSAFSSKAIEGGVLGWGVLKAITTGFDRGIFATDAGTGIVPILQAGARSSNPVVDGLVTLVTPFLVMIVCTTTGLVLLMTGAWQQLDLQSTNMVTYAFDAGLGTNAGSYIVIVSLILFGYTTIMAWACCAERAVSYLCGIRYGKWTKYVYIALIPLGALIRVDLVWILADICITAMLVINIIGIAGLSKEVIRDSHHYFQGDRDESATEPELGIVP